MSELLWRLLLKTPSDRSCAEHFAVIEAYAGLLAEGKLKLGGDVLRHLWRCPECSVEHDRVLERLEATYGTDRAKWSER